VSASDEFKIEKEISELHSKYITTLKFSRNGKLLASAANSGTCVISAIPEFESNRRLAGHTERISGTHYLFFLTISNIKLFDFNNDLCTIFLETT
jgi:WD40 repeat protein